ncbi:hypothetical protein J056_001162 [Wallemia ichthyophaga EXF-994]|uniref:Uncharacterized protein n=1 Tax=Wallemia ichthyophaga (strain EXF-994 / CBS 113033) TaxID=1299270 RepID=R9ACR5_WALI9|nr:uncharacterized protein J056_001162 [Wallemia ichthyophaga EXF-994]EOQ99932.1 hypothetical protein J056_001162 [Wallemia ichthyophaga EXF-994]
MAASMMTSTISSTSSVSGASSLNSLNTSGSFTFRKDGEDGFTIYNGSSLSNAKKTAPELSVVFDGHKIDLFKMSDEKKCIATARRVQKGRNVYYGLTLVKRNCPVMLVDRKRAFTLLDGTECRPKLEEKSYTVIDARSGLAMATLERNTRSFSKFGVLRLFAALDTDSLTFLFMSVVTLIKLQRDRDSFNNLSGII